MRLATNPFQPYHKLVCICLSMVVARDSSFAACFQLNHHGNGEHNNVILPTREQSNIPTYLLTEASSTMVNKPATGQNYADHFLGSFHRSSGSFKDAPTPIIRLHMIRHGETIANTENRVLGQGDSPLTDNGVRLAQLAATSDSINGKGLNYWRTYSSDLNRAHRTAKIVLGLDESVEKDKKSLEINNLIVDPKLRELAKGAREGYDKTMSNEEAMAARLREASVTKPDNIAIEVPKLESVDEAWSRVKSWIDSIVEDVSNDYRSVVGANHQSEESPKVYDIFALSHSALIRTMIHKLVDADLPSNLAIPNLSRTIIDVQPHYASNSWTPTNVRLTDVSHLADSKANNLSPPYSYL